MFRLLAPTIAMILLSGSVHAGPLNPPPGPVTSTHKTITEIEPRVIINATNTPGDADSVYRITAPGSYYLTGNVTGVTGKCGIEVAASGVKIDLGGLSLIGVAGSRSGVVITGSGIVNFTISNGIVRDWGEAGLYLVTARGCAVSSIVAENNLWNGIWAGWSSNIVNCSAVENDGRGISTGEASTVTDCSAIRNGTTGISMSGGAMSGCTANDNTGAGLEAGASSSVSHSSAQNNGVAGITVSVGCTIFDCAAISNQGIGISAASGNAVTISNCSTVFNSGAGIHAGDGVSIIGCTSTENTGRGINARNGCQITQCLTRNNESDGIVVNYSCIVTDNNCNGDGTAAGDHGGIRVTGQANRIESNNVTYADRGVLVEASGNIITRNTAKGCAINWVIVANNVVGPIIDRTVPASAAISGNSAPSSLGSTDPNANFTY